jgi:Protein of unknown function (DUF1579)
MKTYFDYTRWVFVVVTTSLTCIALAEEKTQITEPDMAEMMKKMEAAGTPGEKHKALEPLIGEWNAEVKSWMDPSAPPMISKGTSTAKWVMNGRFVREEFQGEMMGKPFHGVSVTGYDNMKQKYNSVWIDDMSTAIFTSEGTAEDGGKIITFTGNMDCPVTGEKNMPVKHVLRFISPDKHVFEMHYQRKGENSKSMEITYTRK